MTVFLLLACTDDGDGKVNDTSVEDGDADTDVDGDTDADSDTDTIDPVECGDLMSAVTVSTTDYPTAFVAEWTTVEPGTSQVIYGVDGLDYWTTPSSDTRTDHRVVVVSPRADATVRFQAVSQVDGRDCGSTEGTFEAGSAPLSVPELSLGEAVEGRYHPGYRLGTTFGTYGAQVMDDEARPVWWLGYDDGDMLVQARWLPGHTAVAYMINDLERVDDICEIIQLQLDGTEIERGRCVWGHHDFVILPDGRYAYLYADIREDRRYELPIVGDAVWVMDPDGGNAEEIWNVWDVLEIDPDILDSSDPFYPNMYDWTHGNSLSYDEESDSLLVSLHNLDTILNLGIDGTEHWWFGQDGDFDIEAGAQFKDQHGPKFTNGKAAGEIVMFDNGERDDRETSEAVIFELDYSSMSATRTHSEEHTGNWTADVLGDAWMLDSETLFINWGSKGEVHEYSLDHELLWQARANTGLFMGFASHEASIGGPID